MREESLWINRMEPIYRFMSSYWKVLAVALAVAALYPVVLLKLGQDLWVDDNYSHGLLVPFVIGFIVWSGRSSLAAVKAEPKPVVGATVLTIAFVMLLGGTLGAELFTQRISLVVMVAGLVIYFVGVRMLGALTVPFALLLLAIPIPQIVFNAIALPLQVFASKLAVIGIRLAGVPSLRNGNVIDILPFGSTQSIALEVVEACSGIRSLMTLVTLALVLVYFTRRGQMLPSSGIREFLRDRDFHRAFLLMVSAVPIAVATNAARVAMTGFLTYRMGSAATEGTLHEALGVGAYAISFVMLLGINVVIRKLLGGKTAQERKADSVSETRSFSVAFNAGSARFVTLVALLVFGAATVNWLSLRGEVSVERTPLAQLPAKLGEWSQKGNETRFDKQTESVLRATDYTMRDYELGGRTANVYVGYYASQRTGATYHSPKNCLPGSGWVMKEPELIEIKTASGNSFKANRFIIESGKYRAVMIYWYQGRGRVESSEYLDKLHTVLDSVTMARTDGAMVRVMTSLGKDERAAFAAAEELSASLADSLNPFIPN